jgi:hypothetical protein
MELTVNTMQVLKNYASINPNILIEEGKLLKTVSEQKNLLSTTVLDTYFPKRFGIYDLNEFLSVLSLVDGPRLDFGEDFVTIQDTVGRSRVKYFYTDERNLTKPSKEIIMPEADVTFSLSRETLAKIRRAASVLKHNVLSITATNGVVSLSVVDVDDMTAHGIHISNLKMVDGDYEVKLSRKLISHFVNSESEIEYWVALEKSSNFGG